MWDETLFSCFNDCPIQGNHTEMSENCKEIDNNITTCACEYVVNILTAKKWTGIEHQKEKT
jgi:hypothetical protein